jgi:DUF2934 family protein
MKPRSTSDPIPISTETELRMPELEEQIRRRAYDFYEQRGRQEGRELDDWLQAEAELAGTKSQQPLDQWVPYDGWHCTQE